MGRPRLRFVALVATLTIVATACTGGGGASTGKRGGGSSGGGDPGCKSVAASELTRKVAPRVDRTEYLIDATATPTVCYDQITFVFDPSDAKNLPPSVAAAVYPPSYTVQYKQSPLPPELSNSSAASLPGVHAILEVVMTPASENDPHKGGMQTYKGNLRLLLPTQIQHTHIVELLSTFPQPSPDPNASVMVWLIGLDSKRPFTTQSAIEPPRISILIPN